MNRVSKFVAAAVTSAALIFGATACTSEADTASENVSTAADHFEVNRRIVVINTMTDKYLMVVTGACSINTDDPNKLVTTCKTSPGHYKKFYAGITRNVAWTVEQGSSVKVSGYHYKVVFRPSEIIPDVDFQGSSEG